MKLSKKVMAMTCVAMMTVGVSAFAASPNLTVKNVTMATGNYSVSVPEISGSEGGAKVDEAANLALAKNAAISYYGVLPAKLDANASKLNKDFATLFPQNNPASVKDSHQLLDIMTKYADYLGKKQGAKGLFAKESYNVKTAYSNILSVEQDFSSYTGGAHSNLDIKTVNMNLKNGKNINLSDFFIKGSDWQGRLTQMVNIQRIGTERMEARLGHKVAKTNPIKITGNEKYTFTVDKDVLLKLHILYAPGEVAPMAAGEVSYDIPVDSFADIFNYDF